MDTSVADPLIGQLLDGRYRVLARVARGGMATVYQALDTRLDRVVAVKVMHPALADDADFVARFHREARAAAQLSHPDVVNVFDQGVGEGGAFLAMEYVPGRTLRDLLRAGDRLTPEQAVTVCERVLSALEAAHRAGLVHRDVKPENVLVSDDGRVKVADFGLARAIEASSLTGSGGLLLGTVAYLAPEQVEQGGADVRADVYATGILLYEMLTGAPPYAGETALSVAYRHVHEDVPAPSATHREVPAELDALVARATRRDPEQRPADAGEFLRELREVAHSLELGAADLSVPEGARREEPDHLTLLTALDPDADTTTVRAAGTGTNPDLAAELLPAGSADSADSADSAHDARDASDATAEGDDRDATAGRRRRRRWPLLTTLGVLVLLLAGGVGAAWWFTSGRYINTPPVTGQTLEAATERAQDAALILTQTGEDFSETVPAGSVLSQDPKPGEEIQRDGTIEVVLSKGPERFAVPSLVGATLAEAKQQLDALPLEPTITRRYHPTVPADHVIDQDPAPETPLRREDTVSLVVSDGRQPVQGGVPDVREATLENATSLLEGLGLDVTSSKAFSDSVASGHVISQDPSPGAPAFHGDTLTLVMSKGPELVTVPDVVGASLEDAEAELEAARLTPDVRINVPAGPDDILNQSPDAGERVKPGTTVTLDVF